MTHDEVQAVKQRTREEWAKYQARAKPGRVVPARTENAPKPSADNTK